MMIFLICYLGSSEIYAIKMIDGWTWKYISYEDDCKYYFDYQFDGTEEINGQTYHIFRNTRAIMKSDYREHALTLSTPWYVREESGRFYVLYPHDGDKWDEPQCKWNYWITPENREIMLYDFNARLGKEYVCGVGEKARLEAKVVEFVSLPVIDACYYERCQRVFYESVVDGTEPYDDRLARPFGIYTVSQDYGILDRGFLTFFSILDVPGSVHILDGPCPYNSPRLMSVEDEEGNEVFKSTLVHDPDSSVEELVGDALSSSSCIYDLHGREVSVPVPGSIYIRDGKKFVAR
ncbi:MAG: hypothetical protein K2H76_02535 [Muribaculaceae bacterium]|nr:hypothetical protein [Muribaculaceae bacterium]